MTADWAKLPYDVLGKISSPDRQRGRRASTASSTTSRRSRRPRSSGSEGPAIRGPVGRTPDRGVFRGLDRSGSIAHGSTKRSPGAGRPPPSAVVLRDATPARPDRLPVVRRHADRRRRRRSVAARPDRDRRRRDRPRARTPVKASAAACCPGSAANTRGRRGAPADTGALAPPDADVRREILRLELEAEVANLQAEADALRAEAAVEGREPDATPADAAGGADRRRRARRAVDRARRHRVAARRRSRRRPRPADRRRRRRARPSRPTTRARPRPDPPSAARYPRPCPSGCRRPARRSCASTRSESATDAASGHVPAIRRARRLVDGDPVGDRRRGRHPVPRRRARRPVRRPIRRWRASARDRRRPERADPRGRRPAAAPPRRRSCRPTTRRGRGGSPLAVRAAFRFEPARAATMRPNELADTVLAAFRRAVEGLPGPDAPADLGVAGRFRRP